MSVQLKDKPSPCALGARLIPVGRWFAFFYVFTPPTSKLKLIRWIKLPTQLLCCCASGAVSDFGVVEGIELSVTPMKSGRREVSECSISTERGAPLQA